MEVKLVGYYYKLLLTIVTSRSILYRMKTVLLIGIVLLFASPSFCQENISFDEISCDDYNNGFLYVEYKEYSNSKILVDNNKNKIKDFPIIIKETINDNLFYSFTGYAIEGKNHIIIIKVKAKFLNDSFYGNNYGLFDGLLAIDENPDELIENIGNEEFLSENGADNYGKYTISKLLFYKEADDIEELCKMCYATIIKYNFRNIDQNEISRQLYYYLMDID